MKFLALSADSSSPRADPVWVEQNLRTRTSTRSTSLKKWLFYRYWRV